LLNYLRVAEIGDNLFVLGKQGVFKLLQKFSINNLHNVKVIKETILDSFPSPKFIVTGGAAYVMSFKFEMHYNSVIHNSHETWACS
jgi:hypothetical protein